MAAGASGLPPRNMMGSKASLMRASQDQVSVGAESIYNIKEPQPIVVQYDKE